MRIRMTRLLAISALTMALGMGTQARAVDLYFSGSGTITSADSGMGYTVGQAVSFQWTLNSNFTKSGGSNFSSFVNWGEENNSEPPLWTNVQGTGIAGTFQQAPSNGPNNTLSAYSSGGMWVKLNTDSASATQNHGIYLAANPDYFIVRIEMDLGGTPISAPGFSGFAIPASAPLPKPNDYFASYLGTYSTSFTPGFEAQIRGRNSSGSDLIAKVAWNSVTIAQVPEPSTYALGGIGTLTMAWLARRRKAKG